MSRRTTPEGSLLRTVGDLLTAEKVWWCRMNAGVHVLTDKHGNERAFRGHRAGTADIFALPTKAWCGTCNAPPLRVQRTDKCGTCLRYPSQLFAPLWIELKSARGVQSAHQLAFQAEVFAEGHEYLLVRDVREVEKWLKECR